MTRTLMTSSLVVGVAILLGLHVIDAASSTKTVDEGKTLDSIRLLEKLSEKTWLDLLKRVTERSR